MAGSRIKYNPSLTVHQNAVNNGVSDDGIRYYIKTHSIDRSFERKVNVVKAIRNVLKKKPNATMTEVARDTLFGRHTVRKYWEIANGRVELERSNIGRKRIPKRHCENSIISMPLIRLVLGTYFVKRGFV